MALSTATLALTLSRVRNLLAELPAANWSDPQLTESVALALEELNRAALLPGALVRPNTIIGMITMDVNKREKSLATLTGLIDVERVWFPYYGAIAGYESQLPDWVDFELWFNAGVPTIALQIDGVPDGVQVARVFYHTLHTLNGLKSATSTTFDNVLDELLALGSAGYACDGYAATLRPEVGNTDALMRFGQQARRWLKDFRDQLKPRTMARGRPAR